MGSNRGDGCIIIEASFAIGLWARSLDKRPKSQEFTRIETGGDGILFV